MKNFRIMYLALAIIAIICYGCHKNDPVDDGSLLFTDIVKSNYTATGIPGFLKTPGPSSWTGQVLPSTGADQYYEITGWGGIDISVFCDYKNKQIIMDTYTKVTNNGAGHDGYFQALAINASTATYTIITGDYVVAYDKLKKVLDFSGTYQGLPVYVGVVSKDSSTGNIVGAFTELYASAKLILTATTSKSSAAQPKTAVFSYTKSISSESLKSFRQVK